MNEYFVSHGVGSVRDRRVDYTPCSCCGSRYYSGVRTLRTTISCGAFVVLGMFQVAHLCAAGLNFPLVRKWSITLAVSPSFPPAYDAARVYVALRNNQLTSVSLETGTLLWTVECPTTAAPAAGDSLVFMGGDGFVLALAQADGRQQWRTPSKAPSRPCIGTKDGSSPPQFRARSLRSVPSTGPSCGIAIWRQDFKRPLRRQVIDSMSP